MCTHIVWVCTHGWMCALCVYMWLCESTVHVYDSMYMCLHASVCGHVCVRMCMCLWQEADSSAVTAGLTCGLLQGDKWERGKAVCFLCLYFFPFFVFIKCWLLILEVEHCHKKPFAVNKAFAAAWGVNRRPGKPCENHLSVAFTKWVRKKGKMGHPGSSILVPHTGQGSPFPAGMGVTCGCAQLPGYRPTVCTAVREQPSLPAAVKIFSKLSGRLGQSVPGPEDCSPQAWSYSSYEDIGAMAPPHPG